jgi:L-ascorbate metabolism protein UlaG (beta-lactamase superfamily)
MKVTKFPQSCLLLEKDGNRIVIDPGTFFAEKYSAEDLGEVAGVLYTHQHSDHFDRNLADYFNSMRVPLYGNESVCRLMGVKICRLVSGSGFSLAGFKIEPYDLPHFPVEKPPQNTGYIVDGIFMHPGDGLEAGSDLAVANLAVPIGTSRGFDGAMNLANAVKAKRIIPIHFTNQARYPCSAKEFAEQASADFEVTILNDGESVVV